jgi:hypothetical protein
LRTDEPEADQFPIKAAFAGEVDFFDHQSVDVGLILAFTLSAAMRMVDVFEAVCAHAAYGSDGTRTVRTAKLQAVLLMDVIPPTSHRNRYTGGRIRQHCLSGTKANFVRYHGLWFRSTQKYVAKRTIGRTRRIVHR